MTTFTELGLHADLLPALETLGFKIPTPVQALAIPHAIHQNEDLIVVANTGTGKTAAFGLPLLSKINESNHPQGLIIAPTRELANQIAKDLRSFATTMKHISIVTVYGGADIERQIQN